MSMKKFLNRSKDIVPELLEGFALAYPDKVRLAPGHLVARAVPKSEGKVGIVTLGGSGHERFGRARFLGERTRGYPDPGATSIALLFEGFWRGLAEAKGETVHA